MAPSKKGFERTAARRVPTQERSKRRVESILDAAAVVFSESGFEAATTEAIAEKAGTSIGSLYQFFPNKLAVFEALAERCLERSRVAFDVLFASAQQRTWIDALDLMIDGLAALHQSDPAFRAMLVNFHLYGVFEKTDVALTRSLIERVQENVKIHAPALTRADRRVVATTVVHVITGSLFLVRREDPAFSRRLIQETKVVLRRYLEPYARGT